MGFPSGPDPKVPIGLDRLAELAEKSHKLNRLIAFLTVSILLLTAVLVALTIVLVAR